MAAFEALDDPAREKKHRHNSDKCRVVAHSFVRATPHRPQDGHVRYCQAAGQLGCVDVLFGGNTDRSSTMATRLVQQISFAPGPKDYVEIAHVSLAPCRVQMIGAVPFHTEVVQGMQARWMRAMLGVRARIPRILMMFEFRISFFFPETFRATTAVPVQAAI